MMDGLRDYVIQLSATALICAIVLRFVHGNSAVKMMIKLLCGIILSYSIIHPVADFSFSGIGQFVSEFQTDAHNAVQWGEEIYSDAWSQSITQGTEAYILEKAKDLKLDLVVEVELSDDEIPVPIAVLLTGDVAPYAKSVLGDTISRDLNIPKENQTWISQ